MSAQDQTIELAESPCPECGSSSVFDEGSGTTFLCDSCARLKCMFDPELNGVGLDDEPI